MSKKLEFEIGADLDPLKRGLNKATSEIDAFGKKTKASFDRIGRSMTNVGKAMSVGVTLPILALGVASVKAASDAEETASKFNTVFRDISQSANEAAEELRNSYGLARQESQKLLSDTGDLLTGFGFTQSSALDLASEVNKLAVDLASFTNFSGGAEGASQALTKALLGERESVKSLGISILEADVQAKVLENTQKGLTFETERQAKAFATLQIAQDQSKNAIGDYARTSESFANQSRLLKARLADISAELGKVLLPLVTKMVKALTSVVSKFSAFDDKTKKIVVVISGLVAAIGPLLMAFGFILKTLPAIKAALVVLSGPIGLIIAGIVALSIAIYKNWDAVKQWAQDLVNWFIDLYNESLVFRAGIDALILNFKNMFAIVKFVFQSVWSIIKLVVGNIVAQFKLLGSVIESVFKWDWDALKQGLQDYERAMSDNVGDLINNVKRDFNELSDSIVDNVKTAINNTLTGKKEPVNFETSNESLKGLEDKIAKSTADGVIKGLGQGIGRAKVEGVGSSMQAGVAQPTSGNLQSAETGSLAFLTDEVEEELWRIRALMYDFSLAMNELVQGSITDTFMSLGDAIGNALAGGGNVIQNIGQSIIQSMGRFLQDFGKLMIKYGVAALGFEKLKKALFSGIGGPAAAAGLIAAGIALSAIGGSIASQSSGGIGSSGGGGLSGATTPNARTTSNTTVGGGGQDVVFRISGRDLVSVIDRNRSYLDRIGG